MITKLDLLIRARRIAGSYAEATGVDCVAVEKHAEPVHAGSLPFPQSCRRCPSAQGAKVPISCCDEGGEYFFPRKTTNFIHLCQSGFIFWGSSVLWQGQPLVSILASSSLLKEEAESIQVYKMLSKSVDDDITAAEILNYAPKRIQSMAEVLFSCCQGLSFGNHATLTPEFIFPHMSRSNCVSTKLYFEHVQGRADFHLENTDLDSAIFTLTDGSSCEGKDLHDLIQDAFSPKKESLETVKMRALELSNWLAKIDSVSGLLDEEVASANLSRLKEIENQSSVENLHNWLGEITNSFYKTTFKLHDVQHGDALARAIRYIHQNYNEDVSMEDVSHIAALSYSYFSRIFKKEVGVNFNDYLTHIRIEKSKKILISCDISLLEIAQKCGFKDQSYYSKAFKKVTGMSPGKFRARGKSRVYY